MLSTSEYLTDFINKGLYMYCTSVLNLNTVLLCSNNYNSVGIVEIIDPFE